MNGFGTAGLANGLAAYNQPQTPSSGQTGVSISTANPSSTANGGKGNSDRKQGGTGIGFYPPQEQKGPGSRPIKSAAITKRKTPDVVRKAPGAPGTILADPKRNDPAYYSKMHDAIIAEILKEEEEVLAQHKEHIDNMFKTSRQVGCRSTTGGHDDPRGRQTRK